MSLKRVACLCLLALPAWAVAPLDHAKALIRSRQFAEARAELDAVVASEPRNAAAWHQLALAWRGGDDTPGYEKAAACLEKAVEIEPGNETYLADYGGTLMQLAV